MRKFKQGDICEKTGKIFWSYHKSCVNNEFWVSLDTFNKMRGYDSFWSVYYLPKENYYGSTNRYAKRIKEHKRNGKNVKDAHIVKKFSNKQDALAFEAKKQLTHKANGYIFTESWRKQSSLRCSLLKPSYVFRKQVICIQTGIIYNSIRECARCFNSCSSGLSKHLKGHKSHSTFKGLNFKYYE